MSVDLVDDDWSPCRFNWSSDSLRAVRSLTLEAPVAACGGYVVESGMRRRVVVCAVTVNQLCAQ
jgi:hypothetical protein